MSHVIKGQFFNFTGPRSAVGYMSDFRCASDCRSRGEIISMVILIPFASFKKDCCQLQAKVYAQIIGKPPVQDCPEKSVVR